MMSNKSITCKFFAQGICRNDTDCTFIHEETTSMQSSLERCGLTSPDARKPDIGSPTAHGDGHAKSSKICKFFLNGSCCYGDMCKNQHTLSKSRSQLQLGVAFENVKLVNESTTPTFVALDTRSNVPCRFFSRREGCQNSSCPYLHVQGIEDGYHNTNMEPNIDEDLDSELFFTRDILSASIRFDDFGHVLDIDFPTDYSCACITGLAAGTTPNMVVDILHGCGFDINADSVRISGHPTATVTKATVKVRDSLFAKTLCEKLKTENSTLHASIIPVDARQKSWRKLHISWHKATRSVWLNFGNGDIAQRVAKKFNNGSYKCLSYLVKCSAPTNSEPRGRFPRNPMAWTIVLSNVPSHVTLMDVKESIISMNDRPRHVEMGIVSYRASEPEVSDAVRSCLEAHGRLENFSLVPTLGKRRAKAVASFQDEADARAASTLNNTSLGILGKGKLTVTLVQSMKVKVTTAAYSVSESMIAEKVKTWTRQHLKFHAYVDPLRPLTTLKIEGCNAKDVATACRALDEIMSGVVLMDGGKILWRPAFRVSGIAYQKVLSIAKDLGIVIIREKSKQQLRSYGPVDRIQQAVTRIVDMLNRESSSHYKIGLGPLQFSWAIHGGFKRIQQVLDENVAVFDVVSRTIDIHGTAQQYDIAVADVNSMPCTQVHKDSSVQLDSGGDCVICFCEAENSIECSCKHIYCLECFEGYCLSAASSSQEKFQIRCCGSEGTCSAVFALQELRGHLPSSVFEQVLQQSFEEYVKRHPDDFRYCPTPDCGHIYRCSKGQSLETRAYACPSCFEQLCTFCHAQHGDYTCAEYEDIASGGVKALKKLKMELNIKDCPRCETSMEKTMGCNHMTCGGCKAHICWVCLDVFETYEPCYTHMNKVHGGIGIELELELERF